MKELLRVAIASTDGKVINEHFGRANEFYIVHVLNDGNYEYKEKRSVLPVCREGDHAENDLDQLIEILSDCNFILVARIGPPMKTALASKGITVLEYPGVIEEVLPVLVKPYIA
jgi:Uncharacterized conserved protein